MCKLTAVRQLTNTTSQLREELSNQIQGLCVSVQPPLWVNVTVLTAQLTRSNQAYNLTCNNFTTTSNNFNTTSNTADEISLPQFCLYARLSDYILESGLAAKKLCLLDIEKDCSGSKRCINNNKKKCDGTLNYS